MSKFTEGKVYGFDSFEGLPEIWRDGFVKGIFSQDGNMPEVNDNVELIKRLVRRYIDPRFIDIHKKKVSFIHIDSDLYSSAKCIFDNLKGHIETDCIVVFDDPVNYPGFDGDTGDR